MPLRCRSRALPPFFLSMLVAFLAPVRLAIPADDADHEFRISILAPPRVNEDEILGHVTSRFRDALFSGESVPRSVYSALNSAAHPLPDSVYEHLRPHWEHVTTRPRYRARYIVSPGLVDLLTGGSAIAITWYDVVLFREPVTDHPASLALVTHELVHVAQYGKLGFDRFLADYAAESLFHGAENSFEREAGEAEARMFHRLTDGR